MTLPRITAIDLLSDSLAAAENLPDGEVWQASAQMHPEDAYAVAVGILATLAGFRSAEWVAAHDEQG